MKKSVRIFWRIFFVGVGCFVLLIALANFGVFGKMPSLEELENPSIQQASEVIAMDGTLMGKYFTERGNRSNVNYRDISKNVIDALVATEDERFYDHSGIDFKSTMRAVATGGGQGGGSTITQQLAKALLDQGSKNMFNRGIEKLKEWIIAVKLERNFTKEEILTLYLNAVPFGNNIYGIRNAARTFFKVEPDRLSIEQAALLVGMLKGNTVYNPIRNPVASRDRRNVVLGQMAVNNKISNAEAAKLKALPVKTNYAKLDENTGYAPYFREILKDEVRRVLKDVEKPNGDAYDIYKDGLKIYTTINPRMQEYAEEAAAAHMPKLQAALVAQAKIKNGTVWKEHDDVLQKAMKNSDRWKNLAEDGLPDKDIKATFLKKVPMKIFAWNAKREKDTIMTPLDSIKYHRQMLQTAFMVTDPMTGEVRAWVGGINFKTYKFDHANLNTKRQVGSTIKPLLYMDAMENHGFTPETMVLDQQQNFGNNQLVPATGKSCTGREMTMASALAFSRNCASAYIMKQVGPREFSDFIGKLNIPTKIEAFPSMALGAMDLSLFEMMWGYSVFAGRGFSTRPVFITRIEDRNGNVIKRFDLGSNRQEAVSELTSYNMTRMMQGTVDIGTAKGLRSRLGASEMGGKTGTTNDNADAWFMGYTPQLLAGVWIGCDDRFIRIENGLGYGGQAAMPIWEGFFRKVYADKSLGIDKDAHFAQPADFTNMVNSADPMAVDITVPPEGEGVDQGVGNANDYEYGGDTIGSESVPFKDENDKTPAKKDTSGKKSPKQSDKPIGSATEEKKSRKGGFLKDLFRKRDKD